MPVTALDHYHIDTTDLDGRIAFYQDALGVTRSKCPAFDIPGAWICVNKRAVRHINEVDEAQTGHMGAVDRRAIEAEDFERMCDRHRRYRKSHEVVDSRPKRPLREIYLRHPNSGRIDFGIRGA